MRINVSESVVGTRTILVPYCRKHVDKYHRWMGDEQLRHETCSEPLTFDEEVAMQSAWREDPDKLCFIVLDRQKMEEDGVNEIDSMAGDVNAFLCLDDEFKCDEQDQRQSKKAKRCFELSLMVAEPSMRRRGIAREACALMITYILRRINDETDFVAKIGAENVASIELFRKRLGFGEDSFSEVFNLFTLRLNNEKAKELSHEQILTIVPYQE